MCTWLCKTLLGALSGFLACLTACGSSDVAIALATEATPFLQGGPEFEFRENSVPLRLSLNTPFVSPLVKFATCAEALRLHPATASVLDEMRFLISTVMKLPLHPSPTEIRKVHATSAWIHDRIQSLPSESPTGSRRRSSAGPQGSSPVAPLLSPFSAASSQSPEEGYPGYLGTADFGDDGDYSGAGEKRGATRNWLAVHGSESDDDPPDFLYKAVRATALLYSRAVMLRQPFSAIISEDDFLELWTTVWHVSLAKWKSVLGIFHWIMVSLVPAARNTPHDRLVKSMLTTSMLQVGFENWEVASGAMESAVRLQRWLGAESAGADEDYEAPGEASGPGPRGGLGEGSAGERSILGDSREGIGRGKAKDSDRF